MEIVNKFCQIIVFSLEWADVVFYYESLGIQLSGALSAVLANTVEEVMAAFGVWLFGLTDCLSGYF